MAYDQQVGTLYKKKPSVGYRTAKATITAITAAIAATATVNNVIGSIHRNQCFFLLGRSQTFKQNDLRSFESFL